VVGTTRHAPIFERLRTANGTFAFARMNVPDFEYSPAQCLSAILHAIISRLLGYPRNYAAQSPDRQDSQCVFAVQPIEVKGRGGDQRYATLRKHSCCAATIRQKLGGERKCPVHARNDAIDPSRKRSVRGSIRDNDDFLRRAWSNPGRATASTQLTKADRRVSVRVPRMIGCPAPRPSFGCSRCRRKVPAPRIRLAGGRKTQNSPRLLPGPR
jgi:hypothetical protein